MAVLELEAAVTERGQTTVPAAIRKALHIDKRGVVVFRLSESGEVTLASKPDEEPQDPIIENFLAFLTRDMLSSPGRLQPVTVEWVEKIQSLVAGVEVEFDRPLSDDEE